MLMTHLPRDVWYLCVISEMAVSNQLTSLSGDRFKAHLSKSKPFQHKSQDHGGGCGLVKSFATKALVSLHQDGTE